MNTTKVASKLAAFPLLLGHANTADARTPPVDRDDAVRSATSVGVDPLGVLRREVQRLGDYRDNAPPPAVDDAARDAAGPGSAANEQEQDCIMGNIDFGNSTVGALMTRGFPLFTDFGLDAGKIGDAYLELEPMYDIDMENWEEYAAGEKSSQVWTKTERKFYQGGGGNRLDTRGFLYLIGYAGVMNGHLLTLAEAAFENLYGPVYGSCSLNSYCREAGEFARTVGAEPPEVKYAYEVYSGPLMMRTPFSTDFSYTDQDGIKFTNEYLEALEALPEVYDRGAYLAFGRRFGLGRSVGSIQFSNTDVFVADEEYVTMGSKKYEGQECGNPEPGNVYYTLVYEGLLDTLSPIQKARFETLNEIENLFDMVKTNTLPPSPTASPTLPLSPTASPTTPTSGCQTQKQSTLSTLLAAFALFCNLIMR